MMNFSLWGMLREAGQDTAGQLIWECTISRLAAVMTSTQRRIKPFDEAIPRISADDD
jgi:hypothetical protein